MCPLWTFALAAETGGRSAPPGSDPFIWILPIALIFVFYFLILRPQKKREQKRREMLAAIKKGDQVRTIGGIFGEVVSAKEEFVILLVDKERGTTLKVDRNAISTIVGGEAIE
jgi:preprotein translocase subunit YajC